MNAKVWFDSLSFNSGTGATEPERETVIDGVRYLDVPAEHHIHFCVSCQKDYPCTSQHYRHDGATLVADTPPRATKYCPECVGFFR